MKKLNLIFFLSFFVLPAFSFSGDSTQISLLTVLPRPNEVYTVYGHTAIRVCNPSERLDLVFNYGMFNSSKPNFLYHFIRGETDYYLDAYEFDSFVFSYKMGNSTVIEQVLNLPPEQKEEITRMLFINLQPENCEYRYDFLFDNCTTRVRDIIEKYCGGKIVYEEQKDSTTFRTLIHACTKPYPWMTFGIDLLIGNGADSTIHLRQEMFLPEKLMDNMTGAYVISNDSLQHLPVVLSTQMLIQSVNISKEKQIFEFTPMVTSVILFIITLTLLICRFIFERKFRVFFFLLFLAAGLTGCIIWFVALISVHPCTFPNLNMPFFHPFYLIAATGYLLPKTYRFVTWFHAINFVLLSTLLIAWPFTLQDMNHANVPYILCLWASSGVWLKVKG